MSDLCPHFGTCGGCRFQDVPYAEQLTRKADALGALLRSHWTAAIPVEPSPVLWHYRNKVDFSFGRKFYPEPPPKDFVRESVLGFKARGRWFRPLEIHECRIGPEGCQDLLRSVTDWMHAERLDAYDSRSHQGFLRALVVREGRRTGQRMVILITSAGAFDKRGFVEAVRAAYPATSIHCGVFEGLADVAVSDATELLYGTPTIEEQLVLAERPALTFRLSPFSFFQTNTLATEKLYAHVRTCVQSIAPSTLYDLYGGMGCIAFVCSDLAAHVCSVESVASASADGKVNAEINQIGNVTFEAQKVEDYLRTFQQDDTTGRCAAIVDPPRAGMHPKALRRLIEARPDHIIYVSCKPTVFAQELPAFLESYALTGLHAFDLFPHTEHVELVACFSARSVRGTPPFPEATMLATTPPSP